MGSDLPPMTAPSRITAPPPQQTGEGKMLAPHCGTVSSSPPMVVRCMKRLYFTVS